MTSSIMRWTVVFLGAIVSQTIAPLPAPNTPMQPIAIPGHPARTMTDLSLIALNGRPCSLNEFGRSRLIVIAFLGTECPLAKLYGRRLQEIAEQYTIDQVQFVGVIANSQDTPNEIANFVALHNLTFPFFTDPDHQAADRLNADRTPQVFVLDLQRRVRYQGRIDDQYAIGVKRATPHRQDLRIAIDELLSGHSVSVPLTESLGCRIGRAPVAAEQSPITYHKQIAPILRQHCVSCHRPGQAAPFALTDFDQVAGWSSMIGEVVAERRMPPWFANPQHGEFANDARLSEQERTTILQWIEQGCPKGELDMNESVPVSESQWQIPEPDQVLKVQDHPCEIPASGVVSYQYFLVDPGFSEDKFVQAVEVLPGNRQVVHHALVSISDPKDPGRGVGNCGVLINYAPGMPPTQLPAGTAILIPARSRLLVQMHYTPVGSPQTDQTTIGLVFADPQSVRQQVKGSAIVNPAIVIPPNTDNHLETAKIRLVDPITLVSLSPHMHLRGKSFRYEAIYPNGKREVLLDVPTYDFNWQLRYVLKKPKSLPAGTQLVCSAVFDNSSGNPLNPDPTALVRWGDQTNDEMLIGFFGYITD